MNEPGTSPPPAGPPAGWYPDAQGVTRWWDGTAWGQAAPVPQGRQPGVQQYGVQQYGVQQYGVQQYGVQPAAPVADERTLAVLAHVLAIFFGFLGPLVIYLIARPEQRFARHHASEALNFSITLFIAAIVWIGGLVLHILAAVAANRGEWYRYPVNLRLVPGAQA